MKESVTKTFVVKKAICRVLENDELKNMVLDVTGTRNTSLEAIRKRYESETLKIVDVIELHTEKVTYEMPTDLFLANATEITE